MSMVFNDAYAASYDAVYGDKDYLGECDAITRLIAQYGDGNIRRLLDLGCGTGRHAVHLTERGFEVTGVDQSEAMLEHARRRAGLAKIEFIHGDIRNFCAQRRYDLVLMGFNVLGYMSSNDDVLGVLTTARQSLRPGGLLIADFWYGPAVIIDPPGHRFREIGIPDGRILRFSCGQNVPEQQRCDILIKVVYLQDDRVASETEEMHRVRYFFPLELDLILRACEFKLLALRTFPDVEAPASLRNWTAVLVAVSN
jgi:SAM-dependent methyltransferase